VKEVSKPVAHMIVSTGLWIPSSVMMPSETISRISVEITSTLGSTSASRYPGPGVSRRHSGGNEGMSWSTSSGFLASLVFIFSVKSVRAPFCSTEPRRVAPWAD